VVGWPDVEPSDETEVAGWIGPRLHPFGQDVGAVIPTGFEAYARLPVARRDLIVAVLEKHTSTPDLCWLCLWDGYGYDNAVSLSSWREGEETRHPKRPPRFSTRVHRKPRHDGRARVRLPHRDYFLYRGSTAEATGWSDGPNLWWPDDRAWCVASEIDLVRTYVGGAAALIDAVLADPEVNASPAAVDEPLTPDGPIWSP
jgi:hypothetical protein